VQQSLGQHSLTHHQQLPASNAGTSVCWSQAANAQEFGSLGTSSAGLPELTPSHIDVNPAGLQ